MPNHGGVVYHAVDPAELVPAGGGDLGRTAGAAQVSGNAERLAARLRHDLGLGPQCFRAPRHQHHAGSGRAELGGGSRADPAARAGHDDGRTAQAKITRESWGS